MNDLSDLFSTRRVSRKALWRTYVVALLVLFAVIAGSHALSEWMAQSQSDHAGIINLAGKQRMLSQRIAGRILEASGQEDPRVGFIGSIYADINDMDDAHGRLTGKSSDGVDKTLSPRITDLYFGDAPNVDSRVENFLGEARALMSAIEDGEAIAQGRVEKFVGSAQGRLLLSLDKVVAQYQKDSEARLDQMRLLNVLLFFIAVAVILAELFLVFRPLAKRLDEAQQQLQDLAQTDPLTGCWNRRALMQGGAMLLALAHRHKRPLCVIMGDIDRFKSVNDTYGHGAGDVVIREFARTCIDSLRDHDILGRYGGEEFVIVLPDTALERAVAVAERVRKRVESERIETEGATLSITSSFGVAQLNGDDEDLQGLIDRADQALYAAKEGGRNQVQRWNPAPKVDAA